MRADSSKGTIIDLADINPPVSVVGLSPDASVSFIPMADVSDKGQWANRQTRKLREVRSGYTAFKEGDVLFAKITPCMENGKGCHAVGLENGVGFGSTEFHILRAKSGSDARFVFHWSQSEMLRRRAEAKMIGSAGQQRVPADFFETFEVSLFESDEQHCIAEVLDAIDAAIQRTQTLINKLKSVKVGSLNDLLTRGIDRARKLRDPICHPEQFKDSPLGLIPKEWNVRSFGELVSSLTLGTTVRGISKVSANVPLLKMGNLGWGELNLDEIEYVKRDSVPSLETVTLQYRDFLFNTRNTPELVGKTAVWRNELPEAVHDNNLLRVRFKPKIMSPFVCAFMSSGVGKQRLSALSTGTTSVAAIYWGSLKNYLLPIPNEETEQEDITKIIEAHDMSIRSEEVKRNKLLQIKKGLMHDLLTGRVRVSATKAEAEAAPA